jgi:FkbM family methyltransferase
VKQKSDVLNAQFRVVAESILQGASRSRTVVNGAIVVRDLCRRVIRRSLINGVSPETNGEELLIKLIAPSATRVIDVGANVGNWSALCVEHGTPELKVLAFEPSSSALAQLHRRFFDSARVEVIAKAVGDDVGTSEFFEEPEAGEMSSLVSGFSRAGAAVRQVDVTTVDAELERRNWENVDFLKVDTEGYDYFALKGARRSIAAQRLGIVQFEYNAPWATVGATLIAAITLLQDSGYRIFLLKADGLYDFSYAKYGEYFAYSNYDAVAPAYLPKLRSHLRGRV